MINHGEGISTADDVDPALAELAEEIARRLQAGEAIDAEDYVRRHPAWSEPIRRLLPAIRDLVRLGRWVAAERCKTAIPDSRFQIPDSTHPTPDSGIQKRKGDRR